jgi:guanylate kinase
VTKAKFEEMIANNEFIEYMPVHGNYYGTGKAKIKEIQESGRIPILDIDIKGALKY